MILEDRQEYATVVTGLALMGYTAEARALGEAGLTWGSGDRDSLEDALAQIPDRYAMAPDPGAVAGGEHAAFESFKVELPADPAGEKFMSPKIINDLLFGDAPAKAGSPVIAAEFATVVTEILAYNLPDLDPHYPEYVIKLMRRGEVAERTISRLLAFVVDGYIARGTRKSYLLARDALRHVRTLCIDTEDSEFWIHTLRRIRATQARKRALQEILAPYYTEAGLT